MNKKSNENTENIVEKNTSNKEDNFVINYNYNISFFSDIKKKENKIKDLNKNNEKLNEKIKEKTANTNDKKNKKFIEEINEIKKSIKENEHKIKQLSNEIKSLKLNVKKQDNDLVEKSYIKITNLKKNYDDNKVLKNINLNIKKGERVAIIGHNGSGKSTLIEIISKTKRGTSGNIEYNFAYSKDDFGQNMAIQFQRLNYPEGYKVKEVITFFYRMVPKYKSYTKEEFKKLIKDFGINEFYKKSLTSLSGGQQQRVNLFLTFIKKPSFLILDELSAGLDIDIYEKIINLFLNYIKTNNVTTIIVSHNFKEIKYFSQKVFLLKNGVLSNQLKIDDLTEEKFFNLIKREKNLKTNFVFNFKRDKEIKDKLIVKYLKEIRNFYMFWKYSINDFKEKIEINTFKRDEFLIKLDILIEEGNAIYAVLRELILTKSSKGNTKKIFSKKLKQQEKVQIKIDKLEEKNDLYSYLLSDDFSLLRLNRFKKIINIQINYYQIIVNRKQKKFDKYYKKHSDSEKRKKILKLDSLDKKVKDKKEFLINKKELLKKKEKETKELIQKIDEENILNKKRHIDQIKVINLKKYFGIKPAINGINLTIKKGERISITGPNGSGKTTFAEILSTTNLKTIGKIKYWFPYKSKEKIKHEIGMQFQEAIFPYDLKVKEILHLFLKVSMWSITEEELDELIKIFKIENLLEQKGDILSGGERQKLNVLIALLKKPSILILDEISTGLDIESIMDINNYIKKYLDETNATLILISHNPGEAHRLTDKVVILKDGVVLEEIDIRKKSERQVEKIFKDVYIEIEKEKKIELKEIENQ
ncbi:MAG: hypothetical protein HPAVJP_1210 [Candidatus Hepatoplasma vulgare]|nr:MAG: hypothetical protein HPAVJP_1210 [Candidatus Hepatoplasma sp.]